MWGASACGLAALTEHLEATAPIHLAVPPLALVRLAARKPARAPAFALAVLIEFLQRQADISSAWLISLRARRVRYSKSRPSRPRKRRCPPGPCSISSWSHHAASVCRCSCAVDEKGDCLAFVARGRLLSARKRLQPSTSVPPHVASSLFQLTNLIGRQPQPDFSYDDIPPSTFTFSQGRPSHD